MNYERRELGENDSGTEKHQKKDEEEEKERGRERTGRKKRG